MIKVSDILYRGPRPKSLNDLKDHGITAILNLQSGVHEALNDDGYERENPLEFCMADHELPLSDFTPPNQAQVHQAINLIDRSGVTYIHCLHGKDRTGFICAAYRMLRCGWTYKDAVKEMYELGFHKWPYIWWVPFLKKFEVKR